MNKIYDATNLYRINKVQKKKKTKTVLTVIVAIELVILTILIITAFSSNGNGSIAINELLKNRNEVKQYINFVDLYVSNNVYGLASPLIKSIATHEYLVYLYSTGVPLNVDPQATATQVPQTTEQPHKIKYYQFSLGSSSYTCSAEYDYDISQVTGIKQDNGKKLTIGYKDELNFGNLRILNDYVPDTIDIKEIIRKPLIISRPINDVPSIVGLSYSYQ